ncbi:MAG: hypothetical protein RIM84_25900 [Alphaproteobacteria bacterium]
MPLGDGGNPMAEIALALAMAFFSLLVLALVSMRAGEGVSSSQVAAGMVLAASGGAAAPAPRQVLVHWRGRLLDPQLNDIEPERLPAGPLILAVAPDLPVAEAVALRQRFTGRDLTVTALDARWLERLKESTR